MDPVFSDTDLTVCQKSEANVLVDLDDVVTPDFQGVGVQWSAYPWWDLTDDEWNRVFRRLEFMRIPLTRTMQSAFYYWSGSDDRGAPVYEFNSEYQQKLRRVLDWCEGHGVEVVLGEWGAPTNGDGEVIGNDDPTWTGMVGDFLSNLFARKEYRCVKSFNLVNEPHGDWSTVAGRFNEWKRAILNLRDEFKRRGLAERLAIAAPDADSDWLRMTLEDEELRDATGLYDVHWYLTREQIDQGSVEADCRTLCDMIDEHDPSKPLIFGELGIVDGKTSDDKQPNVFGFDYGVLMADAAIQLLRGGAAGMIAWYLDDAMHFFGDGEYVRKGREPLPRDAYDRRKVWGLWNSLGGRLGRPEESELRPWFYPWSLLSRCFPAGAEILSAYVDGPPTVNAVGMKAVGVGAPGVSLAVVNRTNAAQTLTVHVRGLEKSVEVRRFDYYDTDNDGRPDAWPKSVDAYGNDVLPAPTDVRAGVDLSRGITLELPGRGVTIVTTID